MGAAPPETPPLLLAVHFLQAIFVTSDKRINRWHYSAQEANYNSNYKLDNCNCHGQLPGFTIMNVRMMLCIVNVQN